MEDIEANRISQLLSRGMALSIAVEKWASKGIEVIGITDSRYPERYLNTQIGHPPPILYGIGNLDILSSGGLAIVGSRNVDQDAIDFTRNVAGSCAKHGWMVISGGARGIDSEAMLACIEAGGKSVGILADSLEHSALSARYRKAIIDGTLALISPYEPESHFFVGNAMARNRLIYTIADYAMIVSSDNGKGGTWAGAIEALTKKWTPLFVRSGANAPEGNRELIKKGATPYSADEDISYDFVEWLLSQKVEDHLTSMASYKQGTLDL
jgi:predicted Rossmann fold nucleotide-binding protein DprA/Smf involved in DNA uptake